ncbi:MAG: ABC transporter substrate-binding protein [Rickettsiaceae bacterium H1]|nr:ABC transporter substrate-binding protein [Rickettsiaceae bacterium H1]
MYYRLLLFFLIPYFALAKDIYVGISAPLTGPTGFLGREMKLGIETAFHEANSYDGINGNTINLIASDDKYEPFYTELNMKRFAEDENFIAVLGNVGTPTAKVAVPIAKEGNLPFIGAFTGGSMLRKNPPDNHVINYRPGYNQEINTMIKALFNAGIKSDELAFFTQDDDYGDAGYLGIIKSLNLFNVDIKKIQSIPHGRYIRNTEYIEEGLNKIIDSKKNIKAFIMVGTYKPVAKFIKLAKEHYPSAYFLGVSFIGDEALKNELCLNNELLCNEYTKNVIITGVVPYLDQNLPITVQYDSALKSYLKTLPEEKELTNFERRPNSISFEGYIVGKMFLLALKNAGAQPGRESLLKAFEGLGDFDLGLGYKLNISAKNHQASSKIFPITPTQNKIGRFDWKDIKEESTVNMS